MIKMLARVAAVVGWVVVGGALTACKSKTKPAGGTANVNDTAGSAATGDKGAQPAVPVVADWRLTVLPTNAPAVFAQWDMPGRAQAWQGAWLTQPGVGFFLAVEVTGARVASWDGKVEKAMVFALESPCSAKFIERSTAGESSSTTHFTVKAGKLLAGLGDAGSRNGKAAIVCASDVILALDDTGTCTQYTPSFGNYSQGPGQCALASKAGVEVFTATIAGTKLELIVDGDAIYSAQLGKSPDQGFADFAAAKAARH